MEPEPLNDMGPALTLTSVPWTLIVPCRACQWIFHSLEWRSNFRKAAA